MTMTAIESVHQGGKEGKEERKGQQTDNKRNKKERELIGGNRGVDANVLSLNAVSGFKFP